MLTDAEIVSICEETRWLGDLYQASNTGNSRGPVKLDPLVQTPAFVGDFLLDRSLDPAMKEFGLAGLRMIDPSCGAGHLLLQSLGRLFKKWQEAEPGRPAEFHVRGALASVHGVDLDPFAVFLAKLRLLRAALRLSGRDGLPRAPFPIQVAWGNSLLPPDHAMQPHAVRDELRWLRRLCAERGLDWPAAARAAGRNVTAV